MNKNLTIYLAVGLVILTIFLFIPTKNTRKSNSSSSTKSDQNFDSYKSKWMSTISDDEQKTIEELDAAIDVSPDSLQKVEAYSRIVNVFNDKNQPELAAYYVYKKAEVIRNSNSWEITGDNFINLMMNPNVDTNLLPSLKEYALASYESSVELDTMNENAKIKYGQALMEFGNQPMQGVQQLLSVVRNNPDNVTAQLLLAKFGLVSGQYEKVGARLEKVLSLQPQNIDALLMRAEVYANTNQPSKAIQDLRKVQSMPSIPSEMKNQLDVAIKKLQ